MWEGEGERAAGFLFAIKQEHWVFLSGFGDTDENPRILSHCGGN